MHFRVQLHHGSHARRKFDNRILNKGLWLSLLHRNCIGHGIFQAYGHSLVAIRSRLYAGRIDNVCQTEEFPRFLHLWVQIFFSVSMSNDYIHWGIMSGQTVIVKHGKRFLIYFRKDVLNKIFRQRHFHQPFLPICSGIKETNQLRLFCSKWHLLYTPCLNLFLLYFI